MRTVESSDLVTHFAEFLGEVERGEEIVIVRQGRPVARLVREPERHTEEATRKTLVELDQIRMSMPRLTLGDMLAARHEGHRY